MISQVLMSYFYSRKKEFVFLLSLPFNALFALLILTASLTKRKPVFGRHLKRTKNDLLPEICVFVSSKVWNLFLEGCLVILVRGTEMGPINTVNRPHLFFFRLYRNLFFF